MGVTLDLVWLAQASRVPFLVVVAGNARRLGRALLASEAAALQVITMAVVVVAGVAAA